MSRAPEIFLIESGEQSASVSPTSGGLLLKYSVDGKEVVHCPENWFESYPIKIHYGCPVLFPCPSTLNFYEHKDVFHWKGIFHRMPQHGFARHLPWAVEDLTESAIRMVLQSSSLTRTMFPWDFELELEYSLTAKGLSASVKIKNLSQDQLPFHFGFHPYFVSEAPYTRQVIKVPESRSLRLLGGRETETVQPENRIISLNSSLSLTRFYEGVSPEGFMLMDRQSQWAVTVQADVKYFRGWAIWRPRLDAPFVCIEPWTAPPNALNTGEGIHWVESGGSLSAGMLISAGPAPEAMES